MTHTSARRHGAALRSVQRGADSSEDLNLDATDAALLHLLQVCVFVYECCVCRLNGKLMDKGQLLSNKHSAYNTRSTLHNQLITTQV